MAHIRLRNVTKRYGSVTAVAPLDLDIEPGELTVLVGPSGCGKSTTLRMIAGLEDVTSGQILIGGKDVTRLEPKDRDIAMVFQNYALYPQKTVFENLAFGLRMRRMPAAEIGRRVEWAANLLGLDELLQRKPGQLSGGQMQRVALGRALVREPAVFLLDEPLSNLDAKLRLHMREEIARLHRSLKTNMIYVTHDQVEAMTLGDRIVVMKDGRIQQVGTPLQVYDHPKNAFVAGFIGAPEMNLFPARVVGDAHAPKMQAGALEFAVDDGRSPALRPGMSVTVGVRPEHVTLVPTASDVGSPFRIVLLEHMGAYTVALIETCASGDALRLRALVSRDNPLHPGDTWLVKIDPARLHIFDSQTGEAIAPALHAEEVRNA